MKSKEVEFDFNGEKIKVKSIIVPKWYEGIGLMFKRKSRAKPLLFRFNGVREPIHSFFVFFPFYAIWFDENFKIIEVKKVKPWKFSVNCRRKFHYLLEIPIVSSDKFLSSAARRAFEKI